VPTALFRNAQRFQNGGLVGVGTDTVPALLTPGERVLTREENRAFEAGQSQNMTIEININGVTDFDSFRENQGQLAATIAAAQQRALQRNG
jgi:hypothetical protein